MFSKYQLCVIAYLAAAIPATSALGCYSRGPTWDQVNVQRGNEGFPVIAKEICGTGGGAGDYPANYEVEGCLAGGDVHANYKIKNNLNAYSALDYSKCIDSVLTEMFACSHGSEQNHVGFFFYLDPNDGGKWYFPPDSERSKADYF
ncbi:hypothetical protein FPANT_13448 [Fusarium pseudoanthophilum]|uniref:Secreted protein n=1 Tax=Fusarium pseudoanthophilum TaxID=48495 RepID=A0A8H5KCW6_9HYPO|nr:hypothetical protein FPANT_13448 [Fusarium pseudoanthophilum]